MTIHFGYYTIAGLMVGIGVPVFIALAVWVKDWVVILWFIFIKKYELSQERSLPRRQFITMMHAQYYPFMLLQPFHWALPWIIATSLFAIPGGILLDNGYVIGYFTAVAVIGTLVAFVFHARYVDPQGYRIPRWFERDPAVFGFLFLSALGGVSVDTWLQ